MSKDSGPEWEKESLVAVCKSCRANLQIDVAVLSKQGAAYQASHMALP
jgi:hypothetical protein